MEPIKKFQQTIEIQCYSASTKRSYKFHIKNFLRYYHNDLRQENIVKHLYKLKMEGKSAETLSVVKASLIYFYTKVLEQPLTIRIDNPKRKKSLPRPVNREIINKMIQSTTNLKHRTIIEFIYSSGARLSETTNLKWADLDFINKEVRINNGKGGKDRTTLLSDVVVQHLIDLKELRPNKNNPYAFYSMARPDHHVSNKTVEKVLENACKKAGVSIIVTPHQLRHSFGTHLLEEGGDIRIIQELLGHSSPKTTMKYTKVTKRALLNVKSPLDNLGKELRLTCQENVKVSNDCVENAVISNTVTFNS